MSIQDVPMAPSEYRAADATTQSVLARRSEVDLVVLLRPFIALLMS